MLLDVTPDQLKLVGYHLSPIMLASGSVILPGNWGRIVNIRGAAHDWYAREQLLEAIRIQEFPDKPSRLQSAFYYPTAEQALYYWANNDKSMLLYSVVPVDPSATYHLGYMGCLPPLDGMSDEDVARHYWAGSMRVETGKYQTVLEEVVIPSPLRILSQIEIKPEMFHPD